jgi:hypothetical protein
VKKRKSYRKSNEKPMTKNINCFNCANCTYLSEGGYMCDINNDIVIDDFEPTDEFYSCKGRSFVYQ